MKSIFALKTVSINFRIRHTKNHTFFDRILIIDVNEECPIEYLQRVLGNHKWCWYFSDKTTTPLWT